MKKAIGFFVIWFGCAAMYWLYFLRRVPESPTEWLLLLVAGPPAFVLASAIAEGAGEVYKRLPGIRHLHSFAERRSVGQEVSALRILVYLVTVLIGIGLVLLATWLWHKFCSRG